MSRTLTIALFSLAVTAVACKKADDRADPTAVAKADPAKADPAAKLDPMAKPADPKAPDPVAKPADPVADKATAAMAAEAMTKLAAYKDRVCACTDKACAEKIETEMTAWGKEMEKTAMKDFKPDEAMVKQAGELQMAMVKCAAKAAGEPMPDEPKVASATGLAKPTGTNNEIEAKALDMMDKMADMFAADSMDCEKLAVDLKKFIADNKDTMVKMQAWAAKQTDDAKTAFAMRNRARAEAVMAKMAPAQACTSNGHVAAAMADMPK